MTEEELDQVAGGQVQKYIYLYQEPTCIEYARFSFDGDVEQTKKLLAGGSVIKYKSSSSIGHGTLSKPGLLEKRVAKWIADGYIIIKQWEQ